MKLNALRSTVSPHPFLSRSAWLSTLGLWFLLSLPALCLAQTPDLAGVHYPPSLTVERVPLVLNGGGISYRAVAKVYTVGLYLTSKTNKASKALALTGPKQLRFVLLQKLGTDELSRLIASGIDRNSSPEELQLMRPARAEMDKQLSLIKLLSAGDIFCIEWAPKRGTVFSVNGQPAGPAIEEPSLYPALLRVWLGKKPNSPTLKDALLDNQEPAVAHALD